MNPCPCGYYGDPGRECTCSLGMVSKYQKRISGPLLDRIDIHVEVPRVEYEKLADDRLGEPSASVRERVEVARERQRERFGGSQLAYNANMQPADVRVHCQVDETGKSLLKAAMTQLQPMRVRAGICVFLPTTVRPPLRLVVTLGVQSSLHPTRDPAPTRTSLSRMA